MAINVSFVCAGIKSEFHFYKLYLVYDIYILKKYDFFKPSFVLFLFRIPTTFQRPPVEEETSKKPIQRPKGGFGIAIKLGGLSSSTSTASKDVKKHPPKKSVASVFNNDSSSGNS